MSTTLERPPATEALDALAGGLAASGETTDEGPRPLTLGSLPVGARLVVRCRKDWRAATIAGREVKEGDVEPRVVLNVASPSGHTYRLRRPHDSLLAHEGAVPLLGEGHWRVGLVRYDPRW